MKTTKNDSTIAEITTLPDFARKIAAAMYPQVSKNSYSQWEVERLLIAVLNEALQAQHESDIQAFEEIIGEDERWNETSHMPTEYYEWVNSLRAELRHKLREMK